MTTRTWGTTSIFPGRGVKGIAIVIGINIIVLFGIFFFFKRRIDKSLRTEEVVRTIREEIEQLIIELNQTTDRNIAIIEERINELKKVTASADKQIKVLSREVQRKTKESETYLHMKPVPGGLKKTGSESRPVKEGRETRGTQGGKDGPGAANTRERVLSMFHRGEEIEQISKELGITVAEVELIISLSSRRG